MASYDFQNCGTCLGDLVPNGSMLEVDPQADIHLGSIVAVVLKGEGAFNAFARSLSFNDMLGVTKIYLGSEESDAGETIYRVGQLSPPIVSPIPASSLEAMHLVTGGKAPDGTEAAMSEVDRAAMELLRPFFCGGGVCPAVNPKWQPPS